MAGISKHINSDMRLDMSRVREALEKQRDERWTNLDNLYPRVVLLVYVPQAVACIATLSRFRLPCSVLLVLTISFNLTYVMLFIYSTRSLFQLADHQRNRWEMLQYWHQQRASQQRPVLWLMALVFVDFFLTFTQLILLWVGQDDLSTLPLVMPMLVTTYLWLLANMLPFIEGLDQFKAEVWSILRTGYLLMLRCLRCATAGHYMIGSEDNHETKTDGVLDRVPGELLWNNPAMSWEVGNCILIQVELILEDDLTEGRMQYTAWTQSTWTGDYIHLWPRWTTLGLNLWSYSCGPEWWQKGLLPDNLMLNVLTKTYKRTAFTVHFRLTTAMRDATLPDRKAFNYAA